jgi:hypothetical protein
MSLSVMVLASPWLPAARGGADCTHSHSQAQEACVAKANGVTAEMPLRQRRTRATDPQIAAGIDLVMACCEFPPGRKIALEADEKASPTQRDRDCIPLSPNPSTISSGRGFFGERLAGI